MQRDRLVDRAQIVISVRARGADVEPEIDLRKGTNRDCHNCETGRGIVSDLLSERTARSPPASQMYVQCSTWNMANMYVHREGTQSSVIAYKKRKYWGPMQLTGDRKSVIFLCHRSKLLIMLC